jgi:histidine ammonia-lyase
VRAAAWIQQELSGTVRNPARPLQEPYSLRCAPQVIGAVLDQSTGHEELLWREATGLSDNPVVVEGRVFHGGNFHAAPVGLCSDGQALLVHQLAFLVERQLALLLDPVTNCGLPMMLTPTPGTQSGLAGVQMAATSFVARIRQLASPCTITAIPSNLGNQDLVPMALNGANSVAEALDLAWLVMGSMAVAVTQWMYLRDESAGPDGDRQSGKGQASAGLWTTLRQGFVFLQKDRPLASDVARGAETLEAAAADLLGHPFERP